MRGKLYIFGNTLHVFLLCPGVAKSVILLKLTQTGGVLSAKSFGILLLKQSDSCAGGLSVLFKLWQPENDSHPFYVESTFYIVEGQTRYGKISCWKMWGGNLIDPFTERWPHHSCHY